MSARCALLSVRVAIVTTRTYACAERSLYKSGLPSEFRLAFSLRSLHGTLTVSLCASVSLSRLVSALHVSALHVFALHDSALLRLRLCVRLVSASPPPRLRLASASRSSRTTPTFGAVGVEPAAATPALHK